MAVSPAVAGAGEPIGSAVKVVDQVTAELDRQSRKLAKDDGVRQDEVIEVSKNGLGEIILEDETKLALGPGAKLKLDKFVYDPDKTGNVIILNMTRGAFRFITGLAKKPSYVIRTPSASITVRGTIFDAYVEDSGAIWLLLHEGAIQVCNDRGACSVLDDPCRSIRVGGNGDVGEPGIWNAVRTNSDVDFATAFPFVESPPELDPEVRFARNDVERGRCTVAIKPRKTERAEPKYEPKVKKAKAEPKPKSEPALKKTKTKVVEEKPKKKKTQQSSNENTAKAIGLAIGIGLAIAGSKGGKSNKGSSSGSRPPSGGSYNKKSY